MKEMSDVQRVKWRLVFARLALYLLIGLFWYASKDGQYTDGILQLTAFHNPAGLYPPLYGLLSFESGVQGMLVSGLSFVETVVLVYFMAYQLGGLRTARVAAILYAISPLAEFWSARVMSDSLFTCLCTATLYWAMRSWGLIRSEGDGAEIRKQSAWWLAAAVLLGGLATLTRYQGVLLVPPIAMVAVVFIRKFRTLPWMVMVSALIWLLVPLWIWKNGFVHQQQFADRAGATFGQTFSAWWNTVESFVLISPYYFGYPVFFAALFGIPYVKKVAAPWLARPAALLWGSFAVMLLVLQGAFGSFQYRYMLPQLPMVTVLAGVGFARLYDCMGERRAWVPRWAFILSVIYLGFFSLSVWFLQSGRAFQDQKQAALYIKKEISPETKVYSNERYGNFTKLGSVKLSYWSGRPVQTLESPDQALEAGSLVVLGNAYGGNEAVAAWMEGLGKNYNLEAMRPEPYRSWLVPLLDDIMVNPMYNQNPMGWVMRYVPQNFATQIFRVTPKVGAGGSGVR